MRRVFSAGTNFRVPDGTLVAPFFNPLDCLSGLPADLFSGFSVALGTIEAHSRSRIHLMPYVTQLTLVRQGSIEMRMKGAADTAPYTLKLQPDQAALTPAGTLLQLINDSPQDCSLVYVVSPSYLFEVRAGRVIYDDSLMLEEDWAALALKEWRPNLSIPTRRSRSRAAARLRQNPMPKRTP